ncbi:MAG: SlyX family protein, partial [Planctomycetales bacterium]|nr:SlyX family protein [Planctomycetales bacterium]
LSEKGAEANMPGSGNDVGILRENRWLIDRRSVTQQHLRCLSHPEPRIPKNNAEQMKSENERVTTLEIQLTHLQRQYEVLNDVVTQLAMQLDQVNKRIAKWEQTVDRLKNLSEPSTDLLDEKPPHY